MLIFYDTENILKVKKYVNPETKKLIIFINTHIVVLRAIETLKFVFTFENIYRVCRIETTKHKKPLKSHIKVLCHLL